LIKHDISTILLLTLKYLQSHTHPNYTKLFCYYLLGAALWHRAAYMLGFATLF